MLLTTQVALARSAGGDSDVYVAGTMKERAYMRSKTTITEKDISGDKTLDELADEQFIDIDSIIPPPSTAPARPQRSTKK
jgi:hypothetical protein